MMFLLSGFGFLFSSLLLVYNRGYKSANLYLGLFLLLFNFITLTHYLYIYNNSKEIIAFILSVPFNASAYAIGPLAFLYVRSIIKDDAHFTKYDSLHFIIFAIIFIGRLPYNLSDWDSKLLIADKIVNNADRNLTYTYLNNFLTLRVNYALKGLHFLLYLIGIWYLVVHFTFKKSSLRFLAEQRKIVDNWLIFFTVLVSLLGVFLFTFGIMFLNVKDKITFQYEGNVLFSLIFSGLLVLILGLILFPRILYGIPTEKIPLIVGNNEMDEFDKVETESISFDLDYIVKIRLLLENWAAEFKFLDVDSSIYSISKDIDLPFHHVTYFFNQVNNEKFIDWRNKLRIEHSVKLLENKEGYNKTIASLGKESGFKSNSAFIQNFKKITGKLPSEFIKEL